VTYDAQSLGKNSKTFMRTTDANSTSLSGSSAKKFVEKKSFLPGKHGGLDVKRIASRVRGVTSWTGHGQVAARSHSTAYNKSQRVLHSTTAHERR
jgi:hypothetical protein